jgi:RNA:NAD 2'-phosphotransferase (TPT1/KptA family)
MTWLLRHGLKEKGIPYDKKGFVQLKDLLKFWNE